VGAIYIDLTLTPVVERILDASEYSDLDQVSIDCGGSAWFVGRYLERKFGKKSTLYTKIGSVDLLGKQLKVQMKRERWYKSLRFTVERTKQCGVSVHLVNRDIGYHTTFTHKGALADLDWGSVHDDLLWRSRKGGILHLSGYFRTALCNDLSVSLRQLSPDLIVCVDHGRFGSQDHERAARALLEAFDENLIDIYICTISELQQLMELDRLMGQPGERDEDLLRRCNRSGRLPEVTVVRCEPGRGEARAYVVTEGAVRLVECRASIPRRVDFPGRNNAFNAALMYYIVEGSTGEDFSAAICNAVQKALERWADPA
jgi:sugar/nucleoside kinase (ribokinase family)